MAIRAGGPDMIGHRLRCLPKMQFAGRQLLRRRFAFGDVQEQHREAILLDRPGSRLKPAAQWLDVGLELPRFVAVQHIGIAGGTAPVVATALIGATGDLLAPAWFLMLGAALAAGAAFLMKDRSRDPLR